MKTLPATPTAKCIGCSCTDMNACPLGCSWLRVDRRRKIGVCSECPGKVKEFDAARAKARKAA